MEKVFVFYGAPPAYRYAYYADEPDTDRDLGSDANTEVDIYVRFRNDEAHGLGLPLPAGRLRVYKRDPADGALEFVGEDVIDHTPEGEPLLCRLGTAFDLVGDRTQVGFQRGGDEVISETFEIRVRNRKAEPVDVLIRETLYRWRNWEIAACSHEFDAVDSRTIHIPVTVPPGGEQSVQYTVRYTFDLPRGGFR